MPVLRAYPWLESHSPIYERARAGGLATQNAREALFLAEEPYFAEGTVMGDIGWPALGRNRSRFIGVFPMLCQRVASDERVTFREFISVGKLVCLSNDGQTGG